MVRHYKGKDARLKWNKESMEQAVKAATDGVVSILGAAQLFNVPYTSLYRKCQSRRMEVSGETLTPDSSIGRPAVFSVNLERTLAERVKYLEARGFGVTPKELCVSAYSYAAKYKIETPRSWTENKMAGSDWYLTFCKRNNLSLRKPEALSKARAAGVNKEAVNTYFELLGRVLNEFKLCDQPSHIYNMDESGIPLNNRPPKIIAEKGKREVVSLTSVERGENVTVVACCNASGNFIPPLTIFKGVRQRPEMQSSLPTGAIACMSESGYINEELFVKFLEHFQKYRVPGRVLLIVDGHTSHTALTALEYCQDHEIEMICLPPHATHVLQPLDRTVFKSLKANYHKEATTWMHTHPGSSISKLQFCSLFTEAWNRTASVGLATKGFACTGIYPFRPQAIEDFRFAPSETYNAVTEDIPSPSLGPRSQPDVSRIPLTSQEPNVAQLTAAVKQILPSPNKVIQKATPTRTKSKTCHSTSPENIAAVREKRRLNMNKYFTKSSDGKKTRTSKSDEREPIKSKKPRVMKQLSIELPPAKDQVQVANKCVENDNICAFCNLSYYSQLSATKGEWIRCQCCRSWYHERCVGAEGKKQFICGRCA